MTRQGKNSAMIRQAYATWKLAKGCNCGCDVSSASQLHAHHSGGRYGTGHEGRHDMASLWHKNPVDFERKVTILCQECHEEVERDTPPIEYLEGE